jgi:Spy/CpxP family protein refolding chaperone
LKIKSMALVPVFICVGMSVGAFAQSTRTVNVPGGGNGPVRSASAPPGAISNTAPDANATRDPREESIWNAARQLELTSDQRAELSAALKAGKQDRAALDKTLQDARRALADSLANGESFLDSEIENLASANAKVQESDLKLWAKLYAILTPDQQRRLLTMSTPLSVASASNEIARGQ